MYSIVYHLLKKWLKKLQQYLLLLSQGCPHKSDHNGDHSPVTINLKTNNKKQQINKLKKKEKHDQQSF